MRKLLFIALSAAALVGVGRLSVDMANAEARSWPPQSDAKHQEAQLAQQRSWLVSERPLSGDAINRSAVVNQPLTSPPRFTEGDKAAAWASIVKRVVPVAYSLLSARQLDPSSVPGILAAANMQTVTFRNRNASVTLVVTRQQLVNPVDIRAFTGESAQDVYSRRPTGSELLVLTHAEPLTSQVVLVRPGGAMINLSMFSAEGRPDLGVKGASRTLQGIAVSLDKPAMDSL